MEPETTLEAEAEQKHKIVERKKVFFRLWFYPFLLILTLSILGGISYGIYNTFFAPKIVVVKPEPQSTQSTEPQNNNQVVERNIQYKSDNLKLALEYPKDTKMEDTWESPGQTKKLEIFTDNYTFRVSTFTTVIRNLDDIAKVKKEAVMEGCPNTADSSETSNVTVNGTEGRTFEVRNCEGDLTVSYVPKFNVYYEFMQIYKGDIGYKQTQKAITQEILDSVRFYPDPSVPKGPRQTYTNNDYGFSFEHPWLDSECCVVSGAASDSSDKLIILGNKSTFVDKDHLDAIGFFIHTGKDNEDFTKYLDDQRKSLADDYLVVRGTQPKLQEIAIKVDGKDSTLLRGYSWRDNDLIYVDINRNGRKRALVISIKNISGEKFQRVVDEILNSFKFF